MRAVWYGLEVIVPAPAAEAVAAQLWDHPLTGLEEDTEHPGRLLAFADRPWDEIAMTDAVRGWVVRAVGPEETGEVCVRAFSLEDEDWMRIWKQSWRPTPLGRSLVVVPAWWDEPVPGDRMQVRIEPGRAFGTGTHLSTALAWELVEARLAEVRGRWLLDLGSGSGVLSLGAAALNPGLWILATELDPDAIPTFRTNLELNPGTSRVQMVRTDGVPCRAGLIDLAVVNLTAAEHRAVDAVLAPALAPGARLVLSGLRDEQAAETVSRWQQRGFAPEAEAVRGGWTALQLRRP